MGGGGGGVTKSALKYDIPYYPAYYTHFYTLQNLR